MPDTTSRVQAVISRFVDELTAIAREEAARVVMSGIGAPPRAVRSTSAKGGGRKGSSGAKRTPEKLEALQAKFFSFVKSHPGLRIEQINHELGTSTKDLALPIRKLIASKQLKVSGQRRSTKYFAGGGGGNGAAKGGAKKKSKKK